MNNLIFTVYTPLETDAAHAKYQQYYDQLVKNKKEYAAKIQADFRMIPLETSDYTVVNHLKFVHFDEMFKDYDKVMYVDLDVIFNTDEDVFQHEGFNLFFKDYTDDEYCELGEHYNPRSWYYKTFLSRAMCMQTGMTSNDLVPNTGIMISDKPLGFAAALPELKALVDEINEEDMWPCHFDYNNEALFSYWSQSVGLEWNFMSNEWNHIHRTGEKFNPDKKVYHMISKEFEWLFPNPQ